MTEVLSSVGECAYPGCGAQCTGDELCMVCFRHVCASHNRQALVEDHPVEAHWEPEEPE